MADTIFTRALAQAAAVQGSNQALAYQLHVPENTLLRWMSGRAQMPLHAFHRVIDFLVEHERAAGAEPQQQAGAAGEALDFNIGNVLARCDRCDGTQFSSAVPAAALKMTGTLVCRSCASSAKHGELLARLASQAIKGSRAKMAVRKRPARPQPGAKIVRLARS
jgi:hypothetical protein